MNNEMAGIIARACLGFSLGASLVKFILCLMDGQLSTAGFCGMISAMLATSLICFRVEGVTKDE